MKQYSVTFITKKGGEENHRMLTMANNAKEAVSNIKEIWYSENTMHAFRMHAVPCNDIPDTEESVPEHSESSEQIVREKIVREKAELYRWANSLTQSQIDYLCNGGWYNCTIKGYLISAALEAGFTDEQISELLDGLRWAFSLKDKSDADKVYREWFPGCL